MLFHRSLLAFLVLAAVFFPQAVALNETVRYSCYNSTVLLENTSFSDGNNTVVYRPCELGCYEGACVQSAPEHARGFGFLLLGMALFFGVMFYFLKNDVLGIVFFISSLASVMLASWISAVPLNAGSLVGATLNAANMVFWIVVFVLFLTLLRVLFNALESAFKMLRGDRGW